MKTKKVRRHSGRIREFIDDQWFDYWDDWNDYRDSYRYSRDKTKIKPTYVWYNKDKQVEKYNKKNKKLLKRRKAMKTARGRVVMQPAVTR